MANTTRAGGETAAARLRRLRRRTLEIRDAIHAMGFVCPGSLNVRRKLCGKPGCRCAVDDDARHGPYHEWAVYEDRGLTHRNVTAEQAALLEAAIANHREAQRLLANWARLSAEEILAVKPPA